LRERERESERERLSDPHSYPANLSLSHPEIDISQTPRRTAQSTLAKMFLKGPANQLLSDGLKTNCSPQIRERTLITAVYQNAPKKYTM